MLASEGVRKAFSDPAWLYEIKFDGYRTLAHTGERGVQLRTKQGHDSTTWFPEIAKALLPMAGRHVIDGEACVLDDIGRSDFNRIHARAARKGWYKGCDPVTFCAFDILVHDGKDVTALPLTKRKSLLKDLITGLPGVLFVGDFDADARLFSEIVVPLKLEGFVAKRKDSVYRPGERSSDWRKIKRPGWQDGRKWVND